MNANSEDRWSKVAEAGLRFAEHLRPLFAGNSPTLDALLEALICFYIEIPVTAFARNEQHLMIEWNHSERTDWFAFRRGFYDDGRCCDISIDAHFVRDTFPTEPEFGNRVCDDVDALPGYCAGIRSLPIFQRNAQAIPVRLSLFAASNCGDGTPIRRVRPRSRGRSWSRGF